MLSPVPLRLCCLAVMAPALTKADRRADCLPVVLSEPFCLPKTASYNRKDKLGELEVSKLSNRVVSILNKKKPLVHRTWIRTYLRNTSELPFKTRLSAFDLRKSLLNNKVNAESKIKSWHGTNVTLAVADKVRLKYTMNKNNTTIRNMGLARTNMSLGLHSMNKLNRITQFTPRDKTNSPPPENSTAHNLSDQNILTSMKSVSELSFGDVTSSSGDLVTCCTPPQELLSDSESLDLKSELVSPKKECNASENDKISSLKEVNLPISPPITLTGHDYVNNDKCDQTKLESDNISLCNHPLPSSITFDLSAPSETISNGTSNESVNTKYPKENSNVDKAECSSDGICSSISPNFPILQQHNELNAASLQKTLEPHFVSNEGPFYMKTKTCCPISSHDLPLLENMLLKCEEKLFRSLNHCEAVLQKQIVLHADTEISRFVTHCQKELSIPCQKQARSNSFKTAKDLVDLKAELLQSEDVKNLSTAALVSLVRKLENTGTPGSFLPTLGQQNVEGKAEAEDSGKKFGNSEEVTAVKQTCGVLLEGLKNIIRHNDPELTESSDEEEAGEIQDHILLKLLSRFRKLRASLSKKYDWLLGRIHELENQHRSVCDILEKVSSLEDFTAEVQTSSVSVISLASSSDTDLPVFKQAKPLLRTPFNGCLDHNSLSNSNFFPSDETMSERHISNTADDFCSRTSVVQAPFFKKRKLLIPTGLHLPNRKLLKLSTVNCDCKGNEVLPCVLCMGRYNCIQTMDPSLMPLPDRISLLDKSFHPVLSFDRDVPIYIHMENVFRQNETSYQVACPVSPVPNEIVDIESRSKGFFGVRSRSRKLNRYARSLSAKYRKKKHLLKHKLVFGKWRRLQNKSFHARERNRMRRISVASSSSHDSSIPSPISFFDDGSGFDKKRPDDNQFDIDDVIIPYSNKRGRLVKFEFKDIVIPNWRCRYLSSLECNEDDMIDEDISEETCVQRHDRCEIEERKILRKATVSGTGALGSLQKRTRRHRSNSRADSSGANTPDSVLFYDQDIFQSRQDSLVTNSPLSPAFSPPATPSSANVASDDSQPAFGSRAASSERRKMVPKRFNDESSRFFSTDVCDDVSPYEQFSFPLTDAIYDNLLAMSDHTRCDDTDATMSGPSCPASPASTTTSTSTIDEYDDDDDPEWTVVHREGETPLVMKFAKR